MRKSVAHHEIETRPPSMFLDLMWKLGHYEYLIALDRLTYASGLSVIYQAAMRIGELNKLIKANFTIQSTESGGEFYVIDTIIEKHGGRRMIPIPKGDPMTKLIDAQLAILGERDQVFDKAPRSFEYIISKLTEGQFWPHWFRSQRVSYLSSYLTPYELESLGGWGSAPKKAIDHYIHRQWRDYADKIARAMSDYWVRNPPSPEVKEWLENPLLISTATTTS